jgi:predicted PurR-regulated permease PerM
MIEPVVSRPSTRGSLLWIAASLLALFLVVRYLSPLVLSLLVAGIVYYLFAPVVELLEQRRVPRLAATVSVVLLLGGALALLFVVYVPRVYAQGEQVAAEFPEYLEEARRWYDSRFPAFGDQETQVGQVGADALNWILGALTGMVGSLFSLLFGLVIGFYLLAGGPRLAAAIPEWLPPRQRERWIRFGREASSVLAGYLRARLLASIFVGTAYGVAFHLLGLPQALLLGSIGGLLNLVPVIGPMLAAIPALAVAAFISWPVLLGVAVVMLVAQQVESSILDPQLQARYVQLHPAVVVLAVAVGSAVAGIVGLLLAPPVAGLLRAALDTFYRESWEDMPVVASLPGDVQSEGLRASQRAP